MSEVEIVEYDDPIFSALEKMGVLDQEMISCRLYRFTGTGGRQTKEYVTTYEYSPEIEEIAKRHGGGFYQMQIVAGDKKAACNIRIAEPAQPAAVPVQVSMMDKFSEFKEFMLFMREMQPQPQQNLAQFDIMPLLSQQYEMTSRAMMEMQKREMQRYDEMRQALEDRYQEEEEDEEEEEMNNDQLQSLLPVISEHLPTLLGDSGALFAPIVKNLPMFKQIKDNVEIVGALLDGAGITDNEKIKLIKMLNLPAELIPL